MRSGLEDMEATRADAEEDNAWIRKRRLWPTKAYDRIHSYPEQQINAQSRGVAASSYASPMAGARSYSL